MKSKGKSKKVNVDQSSNDSSSMHMSMDFKSPKIESSNLDKYKKQQKPPVAKGSRAQTAQTRKLQQIKQTQADTS
jgi:hypothetical protein